MSQTWIVPVNGFGGGLREADFHRGERAGVIGADGVRGGLAGVAIEAAGDVDGELLASWLACVDPIDGRVERRARFAVGAGAEQGVDEPGGAAGVIVELLVQSRGRVRGEVTPRLAECDRSMIGTPVCCRIAKFVAASPREFVRDGRAAARGSRSRGFRGGGR